MYEKLNSVVSQFLHGDLDYLGMIPQDVALERAIRQQKTVLQLEPNAKSSKAFEVLADNLMNGTHNELSWGIGQIYRVERCRGSYFIFINICHHPAAEKL